MVLVVIIAVMISGIFLTDPVRLGGARFWSDGATYYSMAWSLAADGDLEYETRDIFRVRREYPAGPQGIFLKRASGGLCWALSGGFPWLSTVPAGAPRIYFAKAFIYPVAAAPLVRLFGTRGLLLTNVAFFALALCLVFSELERQTTRARALVTSLALFSASVTPVYVLWQTPEVFNLGIITAGLVSWSRGRGWLAAILLGIATYSKPYNLFLAIPLGLQPLLDAKLGGFGRRFLVSLRNGLFLAVTIVSLFYLNKAVTGEFNYQGGERKTFHQKYFPLETRDVTFGNSGEWMTTIELGPRVESQTEGWLSRTVRSFFPDWTDAKGDKNEAPHHVKAAGPARSAGEYAHAFWRNLGYFWIGRFGGAVWYFTPVVVAMLAFFILGPRRKAGWLALLALLISYLFYIRQIPDNWYGGSGTIGNRYFINLLPLVVFFIPRGRELIVALVGGALGLAFVAPILAFPMWHSLHEGRHSLREPFRRFPIELTMLNDLSIFTEKWRKKRPFGDMGDTHKHWPAEPTAYFLYFPDNGAYGKEVIGMAEGFWLHGGREAEVVLRALEPVRRVLFSMTGGPAGDVVAVRLGSVSRRIDLAAGQTSRFAIDTAGGFKHYDTFIHIVRFKSQRGAVVHDPEERCLGTFVHFKLDVNWRDRPHPMAR